MKLFGLNFSMSRATGSSTEVKPRSFPSGAAAWLAGEDVDCGGAILSNAYQQIVWVYRAINVLAEQVANIPFRFSIGEAGGEPIDMVIPPLNELCPVIGLFGIGLKANQAEDDV